MGSVVYIHGATRPIGQFIPGSYSPGGSVVMTLVYNGSVVYGVCIMISGNHGESDSGPSNVAMCIPPRRRRDQSGYYPVSHSPMHMHPCVKPVPYAHVEHTDSALWKGHSDA